MSDAHRPLFTRGVRGLADGVVSIVLATCLTGLGRSPVAVGAIVSGTLLGSAAVTLAGAGAGIGSPAGRRDELLAAEDHRGRRGR